MSESEHRVRRDPPPFHEALEFQGGLTRDGKTVPGLHFLVFVPESRPGSISGWIFGDGGVSSHLEALMRRPGPYCQVRSKEFAGQQRLIHSDEVILRKVSGRGWPKAYEGKMYDRVATLEFIHVTVEHDRLENAQPVRQIAFLLAGPRTFWPLFLIRTRSYTGEAEVDSSSRTTKLQVPDPDLEVSLSHNFVYSEVDLSGHIKVNAEECPLCLTVTTARPSSELSDQDFTDRAVAVVDDITLLASLGSRAWVRWFNYSMYSEGRILQHTKVVSGHFEDRMPLSELLIRAADAARFVGNGLVALRNLRTEKRDLFMPIANLLTAHETDLLEMKFILQFLALEKLKDQYAKVHAAELGLQENAEVKTLLRAVRDLVPQMIANEETRAAILRKVPELQRPPLWQVVEAMLADAGVEWRDLYPGHCKQPEFVALRNSMVHSSKDVDYDQLWLEIERLRVVLERLLLRNLMWDDTIGAASTSYAERLAASG